MLKEGVNRLLVRLLYGLGLIVHILNWATGQPLILIHWKGPGATYLDPITYRWVVDVATDPGQRQLGVSELLPLYLLLTSALLIFVLGSWGMLVVRARLLPTASLLALLMALLAIGILLWAFRIDSGFTLSVVGIELGAGAYLFCFAAALVCAASFLSLRLAGVTQGSPR